MDRGNLIYLLILAVFLLQSFLKKKKKNAQEAAKRIPTTTHKKELFDDWFQEEEKKEAPSPIPQQSYQTAVTSTIESEKGIGSKLKKPEKQSIKTELKSEEKNNDTKPIIQLENVDDVKKAFIYSEIFQRKY